MSSAQSITRMTDMESQIICMEAIVRRQISLVPNNPFGALERMLFYQSHLTRLQSACCSIEQLREQLETLNNEEYASTIMAQATEIWKSVQPIIDQEEVPPDGSDEFNKLRMSIMTQGPYSQGPIYFDRVKVGFGIGFCVGLASGALFVGFLHKAELKT